MRNKIKQILLVALSGIMICNTPLSVLADTQYAKSGNNTTIESQSEKLDESYENTEGSLFSNQPLDEYLSKMSSNDRTDILEGLDEKEAYQLIVLMQYDYINHFAQNQSLDLFYEVVKNYLDKKTIDTNSSSDDEKEAYNNCLGEWKEEILSYLDTDEKNIKEYEDSIVTSKQFDAKQLKEILQKIVTDINDKENLQSDEDAYIELKKLTFSKNENDKSDNRIDNEKSTKNISYDIISFENYNGKDYYKTEYLNTDETDLITKMLPDTIKGSVQEATSKSNSSNIKSVNIPISWTCEEDIVKNKEKTYLFQAQLAKGYNLSQELKTQLENGDYQLPIYQIKVIEKSKYITGFVNYQGKSDEWYKEINVVSSEKDKISESLPQKIEVTLQNGSNEQINVQWYCNNNIEDDQESSYIYSATLDGYKISDDLQQQIDSGNYKLPEIKVSIVDESSDNLIVRTEQTEVKNGKYEVYAYAPEADKVDLPVWTAETSEEKANNYSLKEGDYTVAGLKYNYKTTVNASKPAKYESKLIATEYVENNDDNIAVAAMESRVSGVCHIGSTYYATINEAVTAGGGTIYVTQSSITMDSTYDVTHNITLRPEGTNVTIKWKNGQTGKCAGLFRGADNKSGFTFDFGGNGNYTLTLDGNRGSNTNDVTYSGVISGYGVNVNLRKGLIIKSSSDQGVYIDHGTITMEDGVTIQYCNRGLSTNDGKIIISGGKILNCGAGLNTQNLTMTGGTITSNSAKYCTGSYDSNNAGVGIQLVSDDPKIQSKTGTINISGGTISACDNYGIITGLAGISGTIKNCNITSNGYGIMLASKDSITITGSVTISNNTIRGINIGNQATLTLASGNITKNTSSVSGAGIGVFGTLKMTGGSITNNASNTTTGGGGGGVYNNGTFTMSGGSISGNTTKGHGAGVFLDKNMNMSGAAVISTNNDVYENGSTYINVTSALTSSKAAIVTPSSYTLGRTLERASYSGANAETIFPKFSLTNKSPYFQRPGNKINSSAKVKATDVVISRTYAINYKANTTDSVSNLPSAGSKYWFEAATVSASIPQRTGYTFKSWNTKSDGTGTTYASSASIAASVNNDLTLYAQWTENAPSTPKTYTVRFNNNGGSGTMSDQTFTVGVSQALKANTFTKSGYTFRGWNTQSNGYGTSYTNRQTVKDLTSAGNTITLYAQWTKDAPKTYTVRFNNNGGSGTMSDQTFTVDVSQALKKNTFTRTGFTFKGWNTQSNGYGNSYTDQQTVRNLTSAGGTITLYAQWTANEYTNTLYYNANGGSGAPASQTAKVTYPNTQSTFYVSSVKPTRAGYTFAGWYDAATGGNKIGATVTVGSNSHAGNQSKTIYAHWTANEYTNTLYYNANGGSGAPASQTAKVTYPNTQSTFYVSSVKPTRAGYTFAGWYDAATGGNKVGTTVTVGSNSHAGNQSKTIYAHWTANEYTNTLYYNANGGSGAPASQTAKVTYPNTQSTFYVSSVKPTRAGYTFAGWYDAATGGNKVGTTVTVGSNSHAGNQSKTIYAHWTANEYTNTLYYNANGGTGAPASQTVKVTYPNTQCTFTVSSVKPTKMGYTFTGWYDAATGGNKVGSTVTVGSNNHAGNQSKTIYAHWTANHYKLTVNPNKGTLPDGTTTDKTLSPDLIYDNGNWNNINSQTPTRKGYTFTGWNTKADGSGVKVYDVNGTCINGCGYWENNVYKGTTDLKVYAQWKANSYTITYNSNKPSNASNSITGSTPNSTHTYDEPKNLTKNGYSLKGWTFTGWNTKADGSEKGYEDQQSVVNLAEKQGAIVVLYAQWRPNTYKIKYDGNGATSGSTPDSNMTYDKPGELNKNGFKKDKATFIGWKDENGNVYKDGETVKNLTPVDKGVVILKAQWDLAPTISAGEKTYYEGTTVTRDDLLKEVTATDPEDGTITNKIIITKIEYSAGKLVSGKKQPSYTQEWKDGMPKEATLDTWFMQLDKADSPVKHKVTYKVVDKVGNVTTKTVTVYVKYNNPPVITAVDRYFTLKEAQNGKVTADELLKNAIEKDKLKSTDIEEGVLSPKLELVGFNPADFTKLTTSAVVTVTYKVHDSYGPNGIGKETVNQIRVYITDPKQPIPGDSQMMQHVRFVTKKYYDLNKDKNIKDYLNNDSELAKINSNGGLRVGCNWYSKDEYKSEITETFDKTSGTTYKFSHEDVKKIQDYINTNGIGNAKKTDSLSTFYQKFLNK